MNVILYVSYLINYIWVVSEHKASNLPWKLLFKD